jgi:hypothetical protein
MCAFFVVRPCNRIPGPIDRTKIGKNSMLPPVLNIFLQRGSDRLFLGLVATSLMRFLDEFVVDRQIRSHV